MAYYVVQTERTRDGRLLERVEAGPFAGVGQAVLWADENGRTTVDVRDLPDDEWWPCRASVTAAAVPAPHHLPEPFWLVEPAA